MPNLRASRRGDLILDVDHRGRLAIVTGGARGIGKSIARLLSRDGAKVAIFYNRSGDEAHQLVEEAGHAGRSLTAHQCDLRDASSLEAAILEATQIHGPAQILVHNAGITNGSPMLGANVAGMREVFEVNFWSAVVATKAVLRDMLRAKFGRVIYIGSPAATSWATQGNTAYAASKAALHAMARQVAAEISPRGNLTANVVAPGYIRTDMTKHFAREYENAILGTMCSERAGTPDEIGEVVSFVASENASYMTGSVLEVDGGFGLKTISRRKNRREAE